MKEAFAVLAAVTVRRDETGEQSHGVKDNQNRPAKHRDAPPLQPPPEQLPRR